MQIFIKYNKTYGLNQKRTREDKQRADKRKKKEIDKALKDLGKLSKEIQKG